MNKSTKLGLIVQAFSFLVMMGFVVTGKSVPDILMWTFYISMLICIVTAVWSYKFKDNASNNRMTLLKGLTPVMIATIALTVITYITLQ